MPQYFDICIPVITLRVLLILLTTATVSLVVLLPFSTLCFNYFYHYLIPTPTVTLPFSEHVLNYDFPQLPPFITFSHTALAGLEPSLQYDFELRFKPMCSTPEPVPLMYKLTLMSNTLLDHLSPYIHKHVNKSFSEWPLTNNIHQIPNVHVLLSTFNTVIVRCLDQSLQGFSKWVPPCFRWVLPPVMIDTSAKNMIHEATLLKGVNLGDLLNSTSATGFSFDHPWSVVLEFNRRLVIDPVESELIVSVSWTGLRYYLYRYRSISYIFGVGALWLVSSAVLFITIGGLIMMREISGGLEETLDDDDDETTVTDEKKKRKGPFTMQGDLASGYSGHTGDIDFTVTIEETSSAAAAE